MESEAFDYFFQNQNINDPTITDQFFTFQHDLSNFELFCNIFLHDSNSLRRYFATYCICSSVDHNIHVNDSIDLRIYFLSYLLPIFFHNFQESYRIYQKVFQNILFQDNETYLLQQRFYEQYLMPRFSQINFSDPNFSEAYFFILLKLIPTKANHLSMLKELALEFDRVIMSYLDWFQKQNNYSIQVISRILKIYTKSRISGDVEPNLHSILIAISQNFLSLSYEHRFSTDFDKYQNAIYYSLNFIKQYYISIKPSDITLFNQIIDLNLFHQIINSCFVDCAPIFTSDFSFLCFEFLYLLLADKLLSIDENFLNLCRLIFLHEAKIHEDDYSQSVDNPLLFISDYYDIIDESNSPRSLIKRFIQIFHDYNQIDAFIVILLNDNIPSEELLFILSSSSLYVSDTNFQEFILPAFTTLFPQNDFFSK